MAANKKRRTTTKRKLTQQPDFQQKKTPKNAPAPEQSDESTDGENDVGKLCDDSSGDELLDTEESQVILTPSFADLDIDGHILVKFATKSTSEYYVGRIQSVDEKNDDIETTFMRRVKTATHERVQFCFPEPEDKSTHDLEDVVMKLPVPTAGQTTKRAAKLYDFHYRALSKYNIN